MKRDGSGHLLDGTRPDRNAGFCALLQVNNGNNTTPNSPKPSEPPNPPRLSTRLFCLLTKCVSMATRDRQTPQLDCCRAPLTPLACFHLLASTRTPTRSKDESTRWCRCPCLCEESSLSRRNGYMHGNVLFPVTIHPLLPKSLGSAPAGDLGEAPLPIQGQYVSSKPSSLTSLPSASSNVRPPQSSPLHELTDQARIEANKKQEPETPPPRCPHRTPNTTRCWALCLPAPTAYDTLARHRDGGTESSELRLPSTS